MAIITLGLVVPDLAIPRGFPCGAVTGPGLECGATPASLYWRECGVVSHSRKVWLCPVHAAMAICGASVCRECIGRGGIVWAVSVTRLSEPVRYS